MTGEFSLMKAMAQDPQKEGLLTHLAFYEFSLLTYESRSKRAEFFTLSQPGGHPHIWNDLKTACLAKIENFVKKLSDSNAVPSSNPTANLEKNLNNQQLYSGRPLASAVSAGKTVGIQNLNSEINNQKAGKEKALNSREKLEEFLAKTALNSYPVKVLKAIKDRFSNNALFNSAPDAAVRSVFAEGQIVIWAIEGKVLIIARHDPDRENCDRDLDLYQILDRDRDLDRNFKKDRRSRSRS